MISMAEDKYIEKIGNVRLNLRWYDGEDSYSDGDIEEELLRIVTEHDPVEYQEIIRESGSWPLLYHLSEYRENVLAGVPIGSDDSVLEIGGGCGAITGYLCRKAGKVTTIDLSKRRSEINAYRHQKAENLEIIVANFQMVYENLEDKYDYIMLIGVLEYAKLYINVPTPYQTFLEMMGKLLKPGGKIVIAIENRFGLKYFAGCKEDHLGQAFIGIDGYSNRSCEVQTFTKKELSDIIESAGYTEYKFYYPYPDYKFSLNIYSDEYLPKKGELILNDRNYDRERLRLFDEKEVFDGLIDNGLFSFFSNSFLVIVNGDT